MMTARPTTSLIGGVLLAALVASSAAADAVVVGGDAPGFEPGQIVKSDARLDIPAGASLTLVSDSGKTVTLKGPHAGPPGLVGGGGDKGLISSLSGLLAGSGREVAGLGVMRAAAIRVPPGDPWVVDVGQAGNHCVSADGRATMWRADKRKTRIVTLKNLGDKSTAATEWPAGADTLDWPAGVSRQDGARYIVGFKGSRAKKKFTLHLVPGALASDAHTAAWMAENGCALQARRVLAKMR